MIGLLGIRGGQGQAAPSPCSPMDVPNICEDCLEQSPTAPDGLCDDCAADRHHEAEEAGR